MFTVEDLDNCPISRFLSALNPLFLLLNTLLAQHLLSLKHAGVIVAIAK